VLSEKNATISPIDATVSPITDPPKNAIDNAGATFKRAENQWVFPSILRAGETRRIVYDVTVQPGAVSSGPLPSRLEIAGEVDSASPAFRSAVIGERAVEITSCLSIPVALAHLGPNTDVVDLRNSEEINFDQLQRAVTFWIEEIGVPQTCDALVDLEMLKGLTARELTNTPVDQPLQQLDFASAIQPTATRTVLTPLPFHQLYLPAPEGDVFRVRLDVSADQDVNGLAVSENLPQTWRLRPVNNAGASRSWWPRTRPAARLRSAARSPARCRISRRRRSRTARSRWWSA